MTLYIVTSILPRENAIAFIDWLLLYNKPQQNLVASNKRLLFLTVLCLGCSVLLVWSSLAAAGGSRMALLTDLGPYLGWWEKLAGWNSPPTSRLSHAC